MLEFPTQPTKENYAFDGWWTQPEGGTKAVERMVIDSDLTFYAHWKVAEYKITYSMPYGSIHEDSLLKYTYLDLPYTPPEPYCPVGFAFDGWNPSFLPIDSVGDKTFVSKWNALQYTVNFNKVGGVGGGSQD